MEEGIKASCAWVESYGGVILGSEAFHKAMEPLLEDKSNVKEIPRSERFSHRPLLSKLVSVGGFKKKETRERALREAHVRYGWSKNMVLASYCLAMAHRISLMLGRIGVQGEFFITGRIAKNPGVVKRLEEVLGIKTVTSEHASQIAGALGAALFADTLIQKGAK